MAREPTPVVSVPFYRLRASCLLPVTNTATFAPKRLIIRIIFCIHGFEVVITGLFINGEGHEPNDDLCFFILW